MNYETRPSDAATTHEGTMSAADSMAESKRTAYYSEENKTAASSTPSRLV